MTERSLSWWRIGPRGWFAIAGILWLVGLAVTPLTESTEGRYASVGEEMASRGDWLEPHYSGLPHYTKPPLAYWAVAASLKVLPRTEWAVRLPATVAALLILYLVTSLARSRGAGAEERSRLRWMLLASPLFLAQARISSGDVYLATAIVAVYWAALGEDRRTVFRILVGGVGFAVGILAKGHIVFLWTLLPFLPWWLRRPRAHSRAAGVMGAALLLGIALAVPWFAWARHAQPGLVAYWLGSETADRVLTNAHSRSEPWWYYLVVLPLVVLPWLPEALRALSRSLRERAASSLLLLAAILPAVVLQLSVSKRPNYLLPSVILLALLAARYPPFRGWRQRCGAALVLLLVAPIGLSMVPAVWPPTKELVEAIPESAHTVVINHELPSSLPFYLGRPVATLGVDRETRFATDDERRLYFADDWVLRERLQGGDVVLSPTRKHAELVEALAGLRWTVRRSWQKWELVQIEVER